MTRERLTLWLLLASTFAIRAIHPDQPIVENYVGRQIPTAMVARNLERGSGFLHPQLDTGPSPNLFLVEPPIYAQVVASIRPIVGFDLEPTGRLVSALATTLAAWGLFGLARRREGPLVALLAVASFALFPVMIRYGRAFQPDALMLGCVLAGLRGWDEFEATGDRRWGVFGGFVLAVGLALKITVAWALIPFVLIVGTKPMSWRLAASAVMLLPAGAWYVFAWDQLTRPGGGSLASLDNANAWARSLSPGAWLRLSTYANLGRDLTVRSFTPVGFVLGSWGLMASGKVDRLWLGWGLGCCLSILGLASKWHHAYYWMVVAPLAAVGLARGLVAARRVGRPLALALGSSFLALACFQSASTWRTPVEWASLIEASDVVQALTSVDQPAIAPEAILYYADRKGFRLEFDPAASRRAAGEWGLPLPDPRSPMALTELYREIQVWMCGNLLWDTNSSYVPLMPPASILVADVGPVDRDDGRRDWRAEVRKRPRTSILVDRPDLMIAELH